MMFYLTLIVVRYLLKYEEMLLLLPSSLKKLSYWLETTVIYMMQTRNCIVWIRVVAFLM